MELLLLLLLRLLSSTDVSIALHRAERARRSVRGNLYASIRAWS